MQYSLMRYQTDAQFAARTDPARRDVLNGAFAQYVGAMQEAGALIVTLGIEPPETAATVRAGDGDARVHAGPCLETKEQLGGLCVSEVPSQDAAFAWARRAPFEHVAVVEVRPTRVVTSA
jgi:hypothetical protein